MHLNVTGNVELRTSYVTFFLAFFFFPLLFFAPEIVGNRKEADFLFVRSMVVMSRFYISLSQDSLWLWTLSCKKPHSTWGRAFWFFRVNVVICEKKRFFEVT